ncbi:LysR family transcriptional regulator, partial [Bordetella pertussis]
MTLKQLEAFYWAATCASFAVAADRLHLSLSSLSKRIAELESALGLDLFDRSGHRAVLTAAGERLLPQARDLLASADRIRASLRAEPELGVRCRFGVGELSALTWLPRLIGRVRGRYPGLALEPYVDVGQVLKRKVAEGELDFAVVAGASSHSAIASAPVGQAHFAWVAAPSVAGAAQSLTPQLLAGTALVSLPDGAGTTRLLDPWL